MRVELKRLQRELGIAFIHVTHAQDEAMALADVVVVMNEGRIEQHGSPREVFNHPRTEFVARFMAATTSSPSAASVSRCARIGCGCAGSTATPTPAGASPPS